MIPDPQITVRQVAMGWYAAFITIDGEEYEAAGGPTAKAAEAAARDAIRYAKAKSWVENAFGLRA